MTKKRNDGKKKKEKEPVLEKWRTEVIFDYVKEPLSGNARKIYTQMLQAVRQDKSLINPKLGYISDLIRHDRAALAQDKNPSGFWLVGETATFIMADTEVDSTGAVLLPSLLNDYFTQAFRYSEGSLTKVTIRNSTDVRELLNK